MLKVKSLIEKRPYIIFICLWLLLLVFLPWRGFYMLNDDYVYEWSTRHFFENKFLLHPLVSPTLLFQSLLGSFFYAIDKSPSILRLLSSTFYLLSTVYLYKYLLLVSTKKRLSFYIALLFMFNPLSIYLGFTFMSDIYFLSMFVISLYYFSKYFTDPNWHNLYLSSIFISLAFFTRQTGLLIFTSFLLVLFVNKVGIKRLAIFSFLPLLSIVSYFLFYPKTLAYTDQSVLKTLKFFTDSNFVKTVIERLIFSLFYIGLFVFPFSFSYFFTNVFTKNTFLHSKKKFFLFFGLFSIFSSISAYFYFKEITLMFYIPNIISYAGFNPQNINDGVKQSVFVDSPLVARAFITMVSVFSISAFVHYLVTNLNKLFSYLKTPSGLAVLSSTSAIFIMSVIFRDFFDRYLVILLPLVFVILALANNLSKRFFNIFLVVVILYSSVWVLFEHDYLSLNKKLWQVAYNSKEYPMLNPKNTHASFEYNNYFYLNDTFKYEDAKELFDRSYMRKKIDNKYLISYTDTWVYCRAERVFYTSYISKYSRTRGYFHIMVKGGEPFDPRQCKDIIEQYNHEKTQSNSNNHN